LITMSEATTTTQDIGVAFAPLAERGPLFAAAQLHPLAVPPRVDPAEQPELDQRPRRGVSADRNRRDLRRRWP